MLNDKRIVLIAVYLGIALYVLPMYPHGGSANELTRWATAASLIEKGSFEMSWTEDLIGPNVDTAKVNGKTFSNKAPGPAIIAAPIYAFTRLFIGEPNASNIRVSWHVMRFTLATLPLLLLAFWLFRNGTDEFGLAALLFATPLFVYSVLLFSHVLAAVLVYAAFRLLFDDGEAKPWRFVLAGAASGLAVISEFPAVFAIAVFGVGSLFAEGNSRFKRLGLFVLGGVPFLIFLLVYNNELFGSPFSMSYAHESFPEWAEVAGQGVFGIGVPSISNAFLLLFSPSRGLFFFSPILILCVINFFTSPERSTVRHRVKIAAIAVAIIFICGHGAAHGGWSFGARYLVFLLPLMLDSLLNREEINIPPIVKGLLLGLSILLCSVGVLTFPFAPPEFTFPHNDFWGALIFREGWFVPTIANLFGIEPTAWTIVPVLAGLIVVAVIVSRANASTAKFAAGMSIGAAIAVTYMVLPGIGRSFEEEFRRATIAERFFKPNDRLAAFRQQAAASSNGTAALRRINEMEWAIANTRGYAPNDFPYLDIRKLETSPEAAIHIAGEMQKKGHALSAAALLQNAREKFPNLGCDITVNLAVVLYTSDKKEAAQAELENVVSSVNPASRAECMRSQFLLGSIYRENGRAADADKLFNLFLMNSKDSTDAQIKQLRTQLASR